MVKIYLKDHEMVAFVADLLKEHSGYLSVQGATLFTDANGLAILEDLDDALDGWCDGEYVWIKGEPYEVD
jgi:hypothetical protein